MSVNLGAAGVAVAFSYSALPVLYSPLEISVAHLRTERQCWGKEDAFVKASRRRISAQQSSEQQVGRVCCQGRTGTAIITCTSNLVFSVLEIPAHLCFLLIAK